MASYGFRDNNSYGDSSQAMTNSEDTDRARRNSKQPSPSKPSSSTYSEENNTNQQPNFDEPTLDLVNQLKERIKKKATLGEFKNTEEFIEKEVYNIRRKKKPELDCEVWKTHLPPGISHCPDSILLASMAYGDDPKELEGVLQAKIKKYSSNSNTNEDKKPPTTSLDNITDPLKQLKGKLDRQSSYNLFLAVREIKDDEIDRADRMFYSEVYDLIRDPKKYTFEIAHNQVQAIRLTHYEPKDDENLSHFIEKCPDFDAAYAYLLQLERKRVKESESNTTRKSNQSIIGRDQSNQNDYRYNSTNQSPSSTQQQFSTGHNPYQHQNSQSGRSDERTIRDQGNQNDHRYNNINQPPYPTQQQFSTGQYPYQH